MPPPRVLVVHNRYRVEGGEERAVELQLEALGRAGIAHRLLERRSTEVGRAGAAAALLRGGEAPRRVAAAVHAVGANVAHFHNMQPLFGPRALHAARAAGARVVAHLHNARLFCAIAVAARDGSPCFRCHGRLTLPGLMLNCRGSLPEAAVYAAALAAHQPAIFAAVDRFLTPSRYALEQLALLGVPRERLEVLPHYLPARSFVERSRAGEGSYALVAARLSPEKGIDTAIEAAARSGVPLRVVGEGPAAGELAALARRLGAPVELLGRVDRAGLERQLAGAGALVVPSRYHEFFGLSALEGMAAGLPVAGTRLGALPELLGPERCVEPNDPDALGARIGALFGDPERRRAEGEELLARARARYSEERFTPRLLDLYGRLLAGE